MIGRRAILTFVLVLLAAGVIVPVAWSRLDGPAKAPAAVRQGAAAPVARQATFWRRTSAPRVSVVRARRPVELGLQFTVRRPGTVTAVRFYKTAAVPGAHGGSLWGPAGRRLGHVQFTGETVRGWQEARFAKPIPIRPGLAYTVSYHAPRGAYVAADRFFARGPLRSGPLTAPAVRNGVFAYGPSSFPTSTSRATNYYADVVFRFNVAPPKFPDQTTTGVPPGVQLRNSGSVKVTRNGAVVQGLDVAGEIEVLADNVTIRNCRVVNNGTWGIIQRKGASGLKIESSRINGDGVHQMQYGILNHGGMITVRRVDMSVISNGVQTDHGLIEDSYFHDPKYFPKDHTDMVMSTGGPAPGRSLVIRHNTVLNHLDQTSAVALFQDFGRVHDALVENNLLAGGGYALYAGAGRFGKPSNVRVIGNVFRQRPYPKSGRWGPVTAWDGSGAGNVWRGNVWEQTGRPVLP